MEKGTKILLAEDDLNLGILLRNFLKSKNYDVTLAQNGKIAYEKFNAGEFHFCIFDVMMPELDGFSLARQIREIDKTIPILFLTAKSMKEDKLEGFSIGADDYLTKPFSMDELLARINAILRRMESKSSNNELNEFQLGEFKYKPDVRLIHYKDEVRKLTTKENQLLNLLVKNQNEILDRNATLLAIWGDDNYFNGRSMDVYIAKLRKVLKDDESVEILNVHGKGFKLVVNN